MNTLLEKYKSGKISVEEFDDLSDMIQTVPDDELRLAIGQDWNAFASASSLSKEKKDFLYPIKERKISRRLSVIVTGIAAAFLLCVSIGLGLRIKEINKEVDSLAVNAVTFSAGTEGSSTVTLPDGSVVRLNARSSITYNSDFGIRDRRVRIDGEGFFDVAKGKDKAFIVDAPGMEITVHGTRFNVYAYSERDFVEMSLIEGSVSLRSGESSVLVAPNEKVCIDRCTGRMNLMQTDNEVETAWLKKTLVFMHEPLYKVIDILERRFGVQIECCEGISLSDIYTGTFKDRSIKDILEVLKIHYGFVYEIDDSKITIRN